MKLIFACLILLVTIATLACSHSGGQRRYISSVSGGENYRAHPASYIVDRFPVEREVEVRQESSLPFYFQQCTRSVGRYIGTNTQYECD